MNNIKAKKRFGQNFLKDKVIINQIIEAMPHTDHLVVEIGPGLGDLTHHLVMTRSVIAFEVDKNLCKHLNQVFKQEIIDKRFTLHCGDILEHWNQNSEKKSISLIDKDYDLVANLPYYIATKIILQSLNDLKCHNILVMVQQEVANKFSANVGEKAFSGLTVLTQSFGSIHIVTYVPPKAFYPSPKIDSAVVLIKKNGNLPIDGFSDFLKIAFLQPRKTLAKNLSVYISRDIIIKTFTSLCMSINIRPHETSTLLYHKLFSKLKGVPSESRRQRQKSKKTGRKQ